MQRPVELRRNERNVAPLRQRAGHLRQVAQIGTHRHGPGTGNARSGEHHQACDVVGGNASAQSPAPPSRLCVASTEARSAVRESDDAFGRSGRTRCGNHDRRIRLDHGVIGLEHRDRASPARSGRSAAARWAARHVSKRPESRRLPTGSTVRSCAGPGPAVLTATRLTGHGPGRLGQTGTVLDEPRCYTLGLHTRFRGLNERQGMVWRGAAGWAEWSPFLDYQGAQLVPWLRAAQEAAEHGWPAPLRTEIPVNSTIPAVDPAQAYHIARGAGCRTAKIKVAERGQTLTEDAARVEAVRDALGPSGKIRMDANGGWSLDEALHAIRELNRFDLEYVEQPCASVDELAELRRRLARSGLSVPIAADESIRRVHDPYEVAERRQRTSPFSKCSRSVGYEPACRLPSGLACQWWSRVRWRPRLGSGPGSRWRPRCLNCRMPAGSTRSRCSPMIWPPSH